MPYNQELIYNKLTKLFDLFGNQNKTENIVKEKKVLHHIENYSILEKECLNKRKACFIF